MKLNVFSLSEDVNRGGQARNRQSEALRRRTKWGGIPETGAVKLGIYRVTDSNSPGTSPITGPTTNQIMQAVNDVFWQACIRFTLADSENKDIHYDAKSGSPLPPNYQTLPAGPGKWIRNTGWQAMNNGAVKYE